MAESFERPDIPDGYIGKQPKFTEIGLEALSHDNSEFKTKENTVEVKFKASKPVKVTHQLINCRTEKELNEYVFTQTKDGIVSFVVAMPNSDYYKLQIYGLPTTEESKSLPNVYNYLIHCDKALTPVYPFPKQYAQWKDGCYLYEPMVLHEDSKLSKVCWKLHIPTAKAVAVVADGKWNHFSQQDGNWIAEFGLTDLRGKNAKVTLNACFGEDETKYATLLEYRI